MLVILKEGVRKLGKVGETVKVRPGYGRYLVRSGSALMHTKSNVELTENNKKALQEKMEAELASANAMLEMVAQVDVVPIYKMASDDGKLFGSVTVRDIKEAIMALHGVDVNQRSIIITVPIKHLGRFQVELYFHHDIEHKKFFVDVMRKSHDRTI